MATPYLQIRLTEVASTQDHAREALQDLPVVVMASGQTRGRGRSGAEWITAPRALAVSLALKVERREKRPISLMAGIAASRSLDGVKLKWPNDVLVGDAKVGGILVERNDDTMVAGLGLNLYWPAAPSGFDALYRSDPGPERHAEVGALWAAELMSMIDGEGWPIGEYREQCTTIGRDVTWEPDGYGRAVDVLDNGELVVDTQSGRTSIRSGAVNHVQG